MALYNTFNTIDQLNSDDFFFNDLKGDDYYKSLILDDNNCILRITQKQLVNYYLPNKKLIDVKYYS